jgi:hypothetical protein
VHDKSVAVCGKIFPSEIVKRGCPAEAARFRGRFAPYSRK